MDLVNSLLLHMLSVIVIDANLLCSRAFLEHCNESRLPKPQLCSRCSFLETEMLNKDLDQDKHSKPVINDVIINPNNVNLINPFIGRFLQKLFPLRDDDAVSTNYDFDDYDTYESVKSMHPDYDTVI